MFAAIRRYNELSGAAAGAVLVIISLLVVTDVVTRLVGTSIGGMTEISENLLVLAIALAFADTQRADGNISVELFVDLMGPRLRQVANVLSKLTCLVLTLLITYGLVRVAMKSFALGEYQFSTLGSLPTWPTKIALAFGFLLLAVELVFQLVEAVKGHTATRSEGDVGTNV